MASVVRLSELLRISGKWRSAYRAARREGKQHPGDWQVHLVLGRLFFDRFTASRSPRHGERAVEHIRLALEANPEDYTSLLLLAMALMRLARYEEAVDAVRRVFRLAPRDRRTAGLVAHLHRLAPDLAASELGSLAVLEMRATYDSLLEAVVAIPGALGAFQLDENGEVSDTLIHENSTFDFSAPVEVVESLARACHLDTERLQLGDLMWCGIRGDGWIVAYRPIPGGGIMAFLDGDVSEEQVAVDLDAALEASLPSAACS